MFGTNTRSQPQQRSPLVGGLIGGVIQNVIGRTVARRLGGRAGGIKGMLIGMAATYLINRLTSGRGQQALQQAPRRR